jgi:opacity protein-like surface antigen
MSDKNVVLMKAFLFVFMLCVSSFFSWLTAQQAVKISSYIQGQYQYGEADASLKVGDTNENPDKGFNRIGIRRGRVKVEYNDGIGTGAVQIEANDKGVGFRDLYIGVKDPWSKRNRLMMGIFNRPFGHEISYSSSSLESPERATIIQYFFPDERDLGAMLSLRANDPGPLNFLRLDAGLFAGNSINRETDNRKDFIGRIGAEKEAGKWGKWGLGLSYYNGSVYNPTTEAYEMRGNRFVRIEKEKTGTFMKREYIGFDGQLSVYSPIGTTTLRAEGLFGTQPGIAGSSKSPNYSNRPENIPANALYKRPFLGYFFYLIQDIGQSPFSIVLKYDSYDPNTKVKESEAGAPESHTTQTDLSQTTIGIGALYRYNKHIRLQAHYELNNNEKSPLIKGYETDRKDNVFTVRVQYQF